MGRLAYGLNPGYVWNPLRQYPRNLTCFCGSGAKFKRCHAGKIPSAVPLSQGVRLYKLLKHVQDGTVTPDMLDKERRLEAEEAVQRSAGTVTVEVCEDCRGSGLTTHSKPEGGVEHISCVKCAGTGLGGKEFNALAPEELAAIREAQAAMNAELRD